MLHRWITRRDVRGGSLVLAFIVASSVAWLGVACASGSMNAPFELTGVNPRVAIDSAGDAIIVFQYENTIREIQRHAYGSFEPEGEQGVGISEQGNVGETPVVAMDARGDGVIAWERGDEAIYATVKHAGGEFPSAVSISPTGAVDPAVAIGGEDRATAVWLLNDGTSEIVQAAETAAGGSFGGTVDLSGDGGDAAGPQVAMDASGDSVASWTRTVDGDTTLETAVHRTGEALPSPNAHGDGAILGASEPNSVPGVVEPPDCGSPCEWGTKLEAAPVQQVVMDPLGEAIAVWRAPGGFIDEARLPAHGSSFGPVTTLADDAIGNPSLAMNGTGDAVAVWPVALGVNVTTSPPGGAFASPVYLSVAAGGTPTETRVSMGASEGAFLAVQGVTFLQTVVANGGVFSTVGAGYGEAKGDSPSEHRSLSLASDAAGDTLMVVENPPGESWGYRNISVDLHDVGPTVTGLSVPTSGEMGQMLSFSIAPPVSMWKPLGSVTWSFGDGSTATGLSPSHTYSQPGVYDVTVTTADTEYLGFGGLAGGFGNSATQTIAISPSNKPRVAGGSGSDTPAGSVGHLRMTPDSFIPSSSGSSATDVPKRLGARRHGAIVSFTLTAPAIVELVVTQTTTRSGGGARCSSGRRCELTRTLGRFTRDAGAGASKFLFTGWVAGHKLKPGSYSLTAQAIATRKRSSPDTIPFRVRSQR